VGLGERANAEMECTRTNIGVKTLGPSLFQLSREVFSKRGSRVMSRQAVDSGAKPVGRIEKELAFGVGVGATSGAKQSTTTVERIKDTRGRTAGGVKQYGPRTPLVFNKRGVAKELTKNFGSRIEQPNLSSAPVSGGGSNEEVNAIIQPP
jgi:hypothetical protein